MDEKRKYWRAIQQYIKSQFNTEPNVHNILFLIGIQELGYGFNQINQDTKTKVINFASLYIMSYMTEEEKNTIQQNGSDQDHFQDNIYKTAIINYFISKKIL